MKKSAAAKAAGTLYVVATPIGNYDDITLRALNALQECDVIVCEESKEALRLLKHYEIDKEIMELNEHNDTESSVECIKLLTQGKKLALISDAGTPLLADPGDILVKTAVKYKIDVRVLPGASSILTALVRSTHSSKQFLYAGFLSRKNEERDAEIQMLSHEPRTIVLMDTPYRLKTILSALAAAMPDRQAYVGCNLTMNNEAHYYGSLTELEEYFEANKFRGEYVIVIEGSSEPFSYTAAAHAATSVHVSAAAHQAEEVAAEESDERMHEVEESRTSAPRGRGRRPLKAISSHDDPLAEDVDVAPLPPSDEEAVSAVGMDDYEPVISERESDENRRSDADSGSRDGQQRDRNWNNNGRRWNNNNNYKRRWDNNRRNNNNNYNDRRDSGGRADGDMQGSRDGQGQRENQGQNYRSNGRNNSYGGRDGSNGGGNGRRHNNGHRNNHRGGGGRNTYRDQQPQGDSFNNNNPNQSTNQNPNAFYDESYDRRENFGNREGANYSRFDQTLRDNYGNRGGYNRGGNRGNRGGNFNRGNAAGINGNGNRSDYPAFGQPNDYPPKRRKW